MDRNICDILSFIAIIFTMMTGLEFATMILFAPPLGYVQGVKMLVWIATSLGSSIVCDWWPFPLGIFLIFILRVVQSSDWISFLAEATHHPFYLNKDVGYDLKLHRMFTVDIHIGIAFVLLHVVVIIGPIFLGLWLQLFNHHV